MYRIDDGTLKEIAEKVIRRNVEKLGHLNSCRIGYLYADKRKKHGQSLVYADTEKVNDKYKMLTNLDFIITFYEPNCIGISDKATETLMLNELNHVGFDAETGDCKIIPHDLEDFKNIIQEYGVEWINQ